MNILFVCSRNLARSPSAERHFRNRPGLQVRSAGTASSAARRVSARDLDWADAVLVMEPRHRQQIEKRFGRGGGPLVFVLDVPDDYEAMDPELLELLEGRVEFALRSFEP